MFRQRFVRSLQASCWQFLPPGPTSLPLMACALGIALMLLVGCSSIKPFSPAPTWADSELLKTDRWQRMSRAIVMLSSQDETASHRQGNGVIVSEDGLVLTLSHVLGNGMPKVTLFDGRCFRGEILFRNPQTDVAIVRISPMERLPYLPMAQAPGKRGDMAFVIGRRAEAKTFVASRGKILMDGVNFYAKNLVVEKGTIHSAPIEQGLSGSALVSATGELLAINAMYFGEEGGGKSASLGVARYKKAITSGLLAKAHTSRLDTSTTPKFSGLPNEMAWVLAGLENHYLQTGKSPEKMRDLKNRVLEGILQKCDEGQLKDKYEAQGEAWKAFLSQSL